jgi:hypothetical protein
MANDNKISKIFTLSIYLMLIFSLHTSFSGAKIQAYCLNQEYDSGSQEDRDDLLNKNQKIVAANTIQMVAKKNKIDFDNKAKEELIKEYHTSVQEVIESHPDIELEKILKKSLKALKKHVQELGKSENKEIPSIQSLLEKKLNIADDIQANRIRYATLKLIRSPKDAEVYIDNYRRDPDAEIYNLWPGESKIKVTKEGYTDCEHTIHAEEGRNYKKECKLEKKIILADNK